MSSPRKSHVRGRPKRGSVVDTETRILDAAEARFSQRGYDAASLADVADDVGIRTPSLYKHFASKRELYVAVVRRLLAPYFEQLGALLSVPTDGAQAEENVVAVARHYLATPNLARLVQHAALAEGEELELLIAEWYGPLFHRSLELTPDVTRLETSKKKVRAFAQVAAFHSMMSGYVTLAPLHARLSGADPFGPPAREAQIELMRGLAALLWAPPAAGEPSPEPAPKKTPRRGRAP